MERYRRAIIMSFCAILFTTVQICPAATLTCAAGDAACLIAAIHIANSTPEADTIRLAAGTYLLTAVDNMNMTDGFNGLPSVTSPITLQGAGADQSVIARSPSAPMFRLLDVAATGHLMLQGVSLTGGNVYGRGGAILNAGGILLIEDSLVLANNGWRGGGALANSGTMQIRRSTVSGNRATASGYGGGIYNAGTLSFLDSSLTDNVSDIAGGLYNGPMGSATILNSTVAQNRGGQPDGGAGGIYNDGDTLTLVNSTVVDNQGLAGGIGGIVGRRGTFTLQNTILAHNLGSTSRLRDNCLGAITSLGTNLVNDPTGCPITLQPTDLTGDPGLDAYTDDDQPGHGHYPLLEDSPLIDAGDNRACLATDQLGNHRAGPCDIGAIEFQPPAAPPALAITLNQTDFAPGQTLRMALEMRNPGPMRTTDHYVGVILPDGQTVLWLTNTAPLQGVVTRLDSNPSTFTPMLRNASWPAGLDVTQEGYLSYRFTGGEAPGVYHLLVGWTKPSSLADGRIDEGDVLALDWKAIQFTGPASTLAAQARD